jgi:hypothetical protein
MRHRVCAELEAPHFAVIAIVADKDSFSTSDPSARSGKRQMLSITAFDLRLK